MTIEVFKTSIENDGQANELKQLLLHHFPGSKINFDLHDCDKILRMEGSDFTIDKVIMLVKGKGVCCTVLE